MAHRQDDSSPFSFSSSSSSLSSSSSSPQQNRGKQEASSGRSSKRKNKDALGQHTRRFQVWLKHSIAHLSRPETTFAEDITTSKQQQQRDREKEESKGLSPCSLSLEATTHPIGKAVSNIDQALAAFSFNSFRQTELLQSSSLSSYVPAKEWDWILDGHPEWSEQAETSRELINELYGNRNDNGSKGNDDVWDFEEWKLQFGSIGNQEYQFAAFEEHEEEFRNLNDPQDVTGSGVAATDDDDDFGDFQEAAISADSTTPITQNKPTTMQDNAERDAHETKTVDGDEEDYEFGDFQNADLFQSSSDNTETTKNTSGTKDFATGFNVTDSIDLEDGKNGVDHPKGNQSPTPPTILQQHSSHHNHNSPEDGKEDVLKERSDTDMKDPLLEQQQQLHGADTSQPDPSCSSPDEQVSTSAMLASGIQPTTPTVNNRTEDVQPIESNSTPSSFIGCGERGAFDSLEQQRNQQSVINAIIPRALYLEEGDTIRNQPLQENEFVTLSIQDKEPTSNAVATGGGEEEEDEISLEATTSSWLSSSTIPSVVRFTSETPSKLVAETGDSPVLRKPEAVRLYTPSATVKQIITHRDLARVVDHGTFNSIVNHGSSNKGNGNSSQDESSRRRYMASPVSATSESDENNDDRRSIYSHEEMASPESRFRRRHSHPKLVFTKDDGRTDGTDDDDTGAYDHDDEEHHHEDDASIIRKLPKSYHYNPKYDDTAEVLMHTIDWELVPYWKLPRLLSPLPLEPEVTLEHIEQVQEQITTRLSEMDTLHLQVTRRLLRNIQPHVGMLEEANRTVHELAKNLSLSHIYVQRCCTSLDQAVRGNDNDGIRDEVAGGGLLGDVSLLDGWDQKRDFQQLKELLTSIEAAMQVERDLNYRVAYFDVRPRQFLRLHEGLSTSDQVSLSPYLPLEECRDILLLAKDLRRQVEAPPLTDDESLVSPLSQLKCLDGLRQRLCHVPMTFTKRLHWWLEAITIQSCGVVTSILPCPSAYCRTNFETLVKALLHVHNHQQKGHDVHEDNNNTCDKVLALSWAQSIETACFFEAKRAFCLALLDPSGEEELYDSHDSANDRNDGATCEPEHDETEDSWVLMLDDFQRQVLVHDNVWEDGEKLRTLTYSLVTIRFDWELSLSKRHGQNHCYRALAPVYHRLCLLLTNVLHGYSCMVVWHEENANGKGAAATEMEEEPPDSFGDNRSKYRPLLGQVLQELEVRKSAIWNHCVQVLGQCLDEYLKFVGKKPLFEWKHQLTARGNATASVDTVAFVQDDGSWRDDLEGLQDVVRLTDQFLSLGEEFIFSRNTADRSSSKQERTLPTGIVANDGLDLSSKLHALLKKHLRTVHVEAMNSMGAMLSKEDWTLEPLTSLTPKDRRKHRSSTSPAGSEPGETSSMIQKLLIDILKPPTSEPTLHRRSWGNQFSSAEMGGNHLAEFHRNGNPFVVVGDDRSMATNAAGESHKSVDLDNLMMKLRLDGEKKREIEVTMKAIYDKIEFYCGSNDPTISGMVPKSVCHGVLRWVSRLLLVMQRLPLVAEDASKVVGNVFDLYATTVFRICVGNAMSERIVLGIDPSSRDAYVASLDAELTRRAQETSSPLFGFRLSTPVKASSTTLPATTISPFLEAELCAPLPSEWDELAPLRALIVNAQNALRSIVKLGLVDQWVSDPIPSAASTRQMFADQVARVLEKRQAAAWSCLFLAAALQLAGVIAALALESGNGSDAMLDTSTSLKSLQAYVDTFLSATLPLVSLSNRVSCVRSIRAKGVVQEIAIVGPGWEEAKLHEHPNLYVDTLCDLCCMIWCSLSSANRLPSGAMKVLWGDLVSGGYAALLDGFSRVPFCSTEGRALMSMDLASFSSGVSPRSVLDRMEEQSLSSLPPPQNAGGTRGMAYVDTFIKVFYYPKMDVVGWIEGNYVNYQFSHCVALLLGTLSSSSERDGRPVSELIKQVRKLYDRNSSNKNSGSR